MKKSRGVSRTIAKFKLELFATKKLYPNVFSQELETFISVFRTSSLNLRLSVSLLSYEKYMFQIMKNICFLFIFSMFFSSFVLEVLIHQGNPNTLGK